MSATTPRTIREFWSYSRREENGCWIWTGPQNKSGYGIIQWMGETKVHRVAYRLEIGSIPPGKAVNHWCHTKLCVNPRHLTTQRTGTPRGRANRKRSPSVEEGTGAQ